MTRPAESHLRDSAGQDRRHVVIIGGGGQLGRALTSALAGRAIPLMRTDLDLLDLTTAAMKLDSLRPAAIINAAGYTNVDGAETEPELASRVNGVAPGFLARWSRERDLPFVHFSTDYVFSGDGDRPWTEDDPPAPLNAYGRSKLEGEREVMAAGGRWLILRTSWVYDDRGRNFLTTILRLARERETLNVVDDQWGAPTYAADLATATIAVLDRALHATQFPSGIYHTCNSGATTWYRFARALIGLVRLRGVPLVLKSLHPIGTEQYPTPARRPFNSRLDTGKLQRTLKISLPSWQSGLEQCMRLPAGTLRDEEGRPVP